jgi:hypothetical protein
MTEIVKRTTIDRTGVQYEVWIEETGKDTAQKTRVWDERVRFGKTPARRPGGAAFKLAARAQEAASNRAMYAHLGIVKEDNEDSP